VIISEDDNLNVVRLLSGEMEAEEVLTIAPQSQQPSRLFIKQKLDVPQILSQIQVSMKSHYRLK